MPLTKLQFKPGINREITSYSNEGGWRDCDKIRFRFGYPEKMGGWEKYTSSTYLGPLERYIIGLLWMDLTIWVWARILNIILKKGVF